jgi:HAMP domain-containing protein
MKGYAIDSGDYYTELIGIVLKLIFVVRLGVCGWIATFKVENQSIP